MEECVEERRQISFDCKDHKRLEPQLFSLNSDSHKDQNDTFLCSKCFNQRKQSFENHVSINDLLDSDEKTIIPKWPPLQNQDLLFEVTRLINNHSQSENNQKELVTVYFASLKKEINKLIEDIEKQTLIKCDKLPHLEEQFLKAYNQIAEKERMKKIFTTPNTDYEQASAKIREILKEKEQQKEENQRNLEKAYNPFIQNIQQFDQKKPELIKQRIIEIIQSINFFPSLEDEPMNHNDQIKNTKLVSELMKMIENRSNHCTKQFIEDINLKFEQYAFIFDSIKPINIYEQEFTQPIDFKEIEEEKLQKIEQLYDNLKQKKEDLELSPQVKLLLDLLNSPSNYLTKESQEILSTILKQLAPFFEHLDLQTFIQEHKTPINFRKLEYEQVELIERLVNKMIEKGYSKDGINQIEETLPNTSLLVSYMKNKFINEKELSLLLQHYPIAEFIQLDTLTFNKSNYGNSQTILEMKKFDNQFTKFTLNAAGSWGTILSDQNLNRNTTYKVIFEINPKNINDFHFCFGLTSKGNQDYLYSDKLSLYIYQSGISSGKGMDKVKKGVLNDLKTFRQFELVVNLSKSILEVSDYPSYNNIAEVDDDKKQRLIQDTQYQIGFSACRIGDELTIQSISIIQD